MNGGGLVKLNRKEV